MGKITRYRDGNRRTEAAEGKRKAAVAKSLRELALLFGKKRPPEKGNAAGKSGADEADQSKLPAHDSTVFGGAQ